MLQQVLSSEVATLSLLNTDAVMLYYIAIVCWSERVVRDNKYSRYDIDDTYYWCQALYYIAIQSSD